MKPFKQFAAEEQDPLLADENPVTENGQDSLQESNPKDASGKSKFVKKIAKSAGVSYKDAGAIAAAAGRKRMGAKAFNAKAAAGRRKAEEVELDEISQETKQSYRAKATDNLARSIDKFAKTGSRKARDVMRKRSKGLKMASEEVDLDEGTKEMLAKYHKYKDKQMSPAEAQQFKQMVRKLKAAGVSLKEEVEIGEGRVDDMRQKVKDKIDPKYHNKYNFKKVKNAETMLNMLRNAEMMKHLKKEEVDLDEAVYRKGDTVLFYTGEIKNNRPVESKGEVVSSNKKETMVKASGKIHTVDNEKIRGAVEEAMSNKLRDKIVQMAGGKIPKGQEFRDLKKKAEAELKKGAEASKAARRQEREAPKVSKKSGEDDHIMMQLRKAQDMDGNYDIKFHKGQGKLNKDEIDTLVKAFDKLNPEGKRKLRVMLKDVNAAKKVAQSMKGKV